MTISLFIWVNFSMHCAASVDQTDCMYSALAESIPIICHRNAVRWFHFSHWMQNVFGECPSELSCR